MLAVQGNSSAADTGNGGKGAGFYAISAALYFQSGAKHEHIVGLNPEVGLDPGVTVSYRTGLRLQSNGPTRGSTSDAAITTVAIDPTYGWGAFVNFSEFSAAQSIVSTGDIFQAEQSLTVANFASLANMTVTGNILRFPSVNLTGAGV